MLFCSQNVVNPFIELFLEHSIFISFTKTVKRAVRVFFFERNVFFRNLEIVVKKKLLRKFQLLKSDFFNDYVWYFYEANYK